MTSAVDAAGIVVATARAPRAEAIDVAREFMDAMERGDLVVAGALLGPGFLLHAPGGLQFRELADFMAFGRTRYLEIHKAERQFDAAEAVQGIVVYAHGVLAGRWLDGTGFQGLRYVDRFLIRENRIVELSVLNELAEFMPR